MNSLNLPPSSLGEHYPIACRMENDAMPSSTDTRWQIPYDYGTIYYCPASRAREHIGLHHHMLGVELTPGIVKTRLNSMNWSSDVMLSGALYFVAAGSTIEIKKEQPIDFVLASIDSNGADRLFEDAGMLGAAPVMLHNLIDRSVEFHARKIRQLFLREDNDVALAASAFVLQAVGRIVKCNGVRSRQRRYQLAPHQIRAALEFVNENLASPLSVERLAQEATGLSGFFFAHAFTEMLGHSPHQYILDRRLARAHELIRKTKSSLAEIAYSVGFSSQSHMTSTFCKRLGVTPRVLRQSLS
jgi:AraC family transcriptional regulator